MEILIFKFKEDLWRLGTRRNSLRRASAAQKFRSYGTIEFVTFGNSEPGEHSSEPGFLHVSYFSADNITEYRWSKADPAIDWKQSFVESSCNY